MFIPKNNFRAGRLLLLLASAVIPALAQPVPQPSDTVPQPSDGDIFLGFRASSGQGAGVALLVNVGNDEIFRNASPGSTLNLNGLGGLGTDLAATYGANWHERVDLHWGFFGARNLANPPVYTSRAQSPVGTPAPEYNALTASARTSTKNKIISVIEAYKALTATANTPTAGLQTNALNDGSYNFQVTGGTTDFGTLSQWTNIEGSFGNGADGTALDLFRLSGTNQKGNTVNRLGTFTITQAGALSFTAAPLLNQVTFESIAYTVQEDAGNVTLVLERAGDISVPASVTLQIIDDTAVAGTDYTVPAILTVDFAANEATAGLIVPILNREGYVGSRSFTATIVSASNDIVIRAPATTTVTVRDIDPASTLNFAAASIQVQQFSSGSTPNTAVLTIERAGDAADSVSVEVSATGGTLAAGTHFTFTSPRTVTFLPNETSKTVQVPLTSEIIPGTIVFSLSNPSDNNVIGDGGTITVNVVPNVGEIAFSAATFNVTTATESVLVTLTRANGSSGAVSVEVSATGGSLVNGTDYTLEPTLVNFADGITTASLNLPLSTNQAGTILLTLANPTGSASIGTQGTATINVLGAPGSISFVASQYYVFEEAGVLNIPIVRSNGSAGGVTVSVNTLNGTATAPGDFTQLINYQVSFADGITTAQVPISIILDQVKNEPNETFIVTLGNTSGGAQLGAITTATVTILDADTSAPSLTVTSPKKNAKLPETGDDRIAVTGTVKDNKGVAKVEVKINSGEYAEAELTEDAKGVISFTLNVPAERGTNTLTVRSSDHRGNASKEVTLSFIYDDPYPAIAGTYTGLTTAKAPSAPSNGTEGRIVTTVTNKGTFSGKLDLDGLTHSFSGTIANNGTGLFGKTLEEQVTITRKGKSNLALALEFDLAKDNNSHKVTGLVTTGEASAELEADRLLYTNKANPVAPLVNPPANLIGSYTVLFEALSSEAQNRAESDYPQGDGWATVTVSNAGIVKITGSLADGSALTFSGPLSIANRLPFFVPLYKKLGGISGPVKFANLAETDVDGTDLFWFRPADAKSKVYPEGWADGIITDLAGSKFTKAAKNDALSILGFVGEGSLQLTGGALEASIDKSFTITANNKVTPADKSFSVAVAGATGIVSGSFTPEGQKKKLNYKGVVLQKNQKVSGYFLGSSTPAESGKATLSIATPAQ